MSVLSDRWIKKMAIEKEMIKPFVKSRKQKKIFLMDYLLLAMMLEFLMNLKFLPM